MNHTMNKETKKSLTREYFEKVYEAKDDPWDFENSRYEADKYHATLDALPLEKYESAFEIGCSIGVLTAKLAERCKKLLAVDVSQKALNQAKKRCENLPNVKLEIMQIPKEFPPETFDLILISEVGYYLTEKDWQAAMKKVFAQLDSKGHVVLVHWTPLVHDYPQTGDAVHDSLAAFGTDKMQHLKSQKNDNYRLDVWEKI